MDIVRVPKFYPQFLLTMVGFPTLPLQSLFMRHTELVHLLALQRCKGVGGITARKLLAHFASAEEIFSKPASELARIPGIGLQLAQKIHASKDSKRAVAEIAFAGAANIQILPFTDPNFPENLKNCPDAPLILFSKGNIDLQNRHIISIVGTRKVTTAGADFCRKLIADLAPLDPVIVSGLAYGVDIVAHQAALENKLQTVAVLAHGLDQVYPSAHKKQVARILENGGLLSEFWSGTPPMSENFVSRNRIVAGLSEASIIIESAEKGGSLITANLAFDYNREVFAVPGRPQDAMSQGCNLLIKTQRAQILTSAADLVYAMNWDIRTSAPSVQKKLFVELSPEEDELYRYLSENNKQTLDELARNLGQSIQNLSVLLLQMELKGAIRPLPGKIFEAV